MRNTLVSRRQPLATALMLGLVLMLLQGMEGHTRQELARLLSVLAQGSVDCQIAQPAPVLTPAPVRAL